MAWYGSLLLPPRLCIDMKHDQLLAKTLQRERESEREKENICFINILLELPDSSMST